MRVSVMVLFLLFLPFYSFTQTEAASAEPGIYDFYPVQKEPYPLNLLQIKERIKFPISAIKAQVDGILYVRILVNNEGEYVKHKITRDIHPELQQEVERHLPDLIFTPAEQNGERISYWVNIPFNFKLKDKKKSKQLMLLYNRSIFTKYKGINKAQRHLESAHAWYNEGIYYKAIGAYFRSINSNPCKKKKSSPSTTLLFEAYRGKGLAQMESGYYADASIDLTEAIGLAMGFKEDNEAIYGQLPILYQNRGMSYFHNAYWHQALNDFYWLLQRYPEHPSSHEVILYTAHCHFALKQYTEAFALLEAMPSSLQLSHSYELLNGKIFIAQQDYTQAVVHFTKALAMAGSQAERMMSQYYLGLCAYQRQDVEEAFYYIQQALEIDALHPDLHYLKAQLFIQIGNSEYACNSLEQALIHGLQGRASAYARGYIQKHCPSLWQVE